MRVEPRVAGKGGKLFFKLISALVLAALVFV
jgi:hypothetical protein